jgi:hypothetical protein
VTEGKRVRWKVILPIVMTAASVFLLALADRQRGGDGMGWSPPAAVIAQWLNGPGFAFTFFVRAPHAIEELLGYDTGRLLGIALFWFLIGRMLDRPRLPERNPRTAAALYAVGSIVCGVLVFGWTYAQWRLGLGLAFYLNRVVLLHSMTGGQIGLALWLVGFTFYFAYRTFRAAKQLRQSA